MVEVIEISYYANECRTRFAVRRNSYSCKWNGLKTDIEICSRKFKLFRLLLTLIHDPNSQPGLVIWRNAEAVDVLNHDFDIKSFDI